MIVILISWIKNSKESLETKPPQFEMVIIVIVIDVVIGAGFKGEGLR